MLFSFSDFGYPELNVKEEPDLLQVPFHHHFTFGVEHGHGTGTGTGPGHGTGTGTGSGGKGSKSGSGRSSNAPPPTPWVPPLWKQQYENIRKMREARNAPVDTHGCFMLAEKDIPPEVIHVHSQEVR